MEYYKLEKTQYVGKLILTAASAKKFGKAGLNKWDFGRSYSFEKKYKEYIDRGRYNLVSVPDIICKNNKFRDMRPIKIMEDVRYVIEDQEGNSRPFDRNKLKDSWQKIILDIHPTGSMVGPNSFYLFPFVDFTSVKTLSESLSFLGENRSSDIVYTLSNVLCFVDADYKIEKNSSLSPDKILTSIIIEQYNFFFEDTDYNYRDMPFNCADLLNNNLIVRTHKKNDVLIDLLSKKKQIIY